MKRRSATVFLVALLLAFCRSASADPITAGSMVYTARTSPTLSSPSLRIAVSGDRFSLDGGFDLFDNNSFGANESCRIGLCNPGQSIGFGAGFTIPDIGGTLTLDGRSFPLSNQEHATLHINWSATVVTP